MSRLYIVPTPVGNLEDITLRALRVLREADLILAEDTRTSSVLLRHYDIHKPVLAYHKFNEHDITSNIVSRLQAGEVMAMISDAGTPGISDPGFLLIRACIAGGVEVETLPGATAFVPALVNSGIPCDRFVFEGFLPAKKGRQSRLQLLTSEPRTMIFYESPFRLAKTLEELAHHFGPDRKAAVMRELTKKFEEHNRGSLAELAGYYTQKTVKGEIVLIVEGKNS